MKQAFFLIVITLLLCEPARSAETRDTSTPKNALLGHWLILGEKTHIYFNNNGKCEIVYEENSRDNIHAKYTVLGQSSSDGRITIRIEYQSYMEHFIGGLDEVTLSGQLSQDYKSFKGTTWYSRNKVIFWKSKNNKPPDMIYVDSRKKP